MSKKSIRIGCGAGFSGDRLEPAEILIERGHVDILVLECLAERTIALAQKRKLQDPNLGYDPLLERRIARLLPYIHRHQVRLITNMGAANPLAAAQKIIEIAHAQGISIKVAVVTGDDVLPSLDVKAASIETGVPIQNLGEIISANAYLGIDALLPALHTDAQIIITGRVADPSLFLAPMVHHFDWDTTDYHLLGQGTVVGHLLECAGQLTGGYYADPIKKPVAGMATLGHPIAEIQHYGKAVLCKPPHTGGELSVRTAKEQLLYEVVNPHAYLTPDVAADFTQVELNQIGTDLVEVSGGTGNTRPSTLKVSVGYKAGFLGEGEIAYAGPEALARARWAGDIIQARLSPLLPDLQIDLLGYNAVHRGQFSPSPPPPEVRLRVASMTADPALAQLLGEEVEALYTNGPAGGGGVKKQVTETIGIASVLLPREQVRHELHLFAS